MSEGVTSAIVAPPSRDAGKVEKEIRTVPFAGVFSAPEPEEPEEPEPDEPESLFQKEQEAKAKRNKTENTTRNIKRCLKERTKDAGFFF